MANSVVLFNAARSKQIEDTAITSGLVDANGNLILKTRAGVEQNAGNVRGPRGSDAQYPLPNTSGTAAYIRLGTLDGGSIYQGARLNFWLSGLGNYGTPQSATVLVHAQQRGADIIAVSAWSYGITAANAPIQLYTRKLGPFLFEIWYKAAPYQAQATLTTLSLWSATLNLDSMSTTMPSDLSEVPIQVAESNIAPSSTVGVTGNGAINTPFQLTVRALEDPALPVGLLDHSFRGGRARVRIGGVWSTQKYEWACAYDPQGSREVRLLKTASTYVIAGQKDSSETIDLNRANFAIYSEYTNNSIWANRIRSVKLPSGLVVLSGMLVGLGVPPVDTVVGQLAEGHRPDTEMLFPIEYADQARSVRISPSGHIRVSGSTALPSNAYLSLDGIAFWSAGSATWTPIGSGGSSLGPNFEFDPSWVALYGTPSFFKDEYGSVWFRGLLRVRATTTTDNTLMVNLPATHRAWREEHQRVAASETFGLVGTSVSAGLTWKTGTPGSVGNWISLTAVVIRTAESNTRINWQDKPQKIGNWGNYSSNFPGGGIAIREDGLRMATGLLNGGSIPGGLWLPGEREFWPKFGRIIIPIATANSRGRLDMYGPGESPGQEGLFYITHGASGWTSLDGRVWTP